MCFSMWVISPSKRRGCISPWSTRLSSRVRVFRLLLPLISTTMASEKFSSPHTMQKFRFFICYCYYYFFTFHEILKHTHLYCKLRWVFLLRFWNHTIFVWMKGLCNARMIAEVSLFSNNVCVSFGRQAKAMATGVIDCQNSLSHWVGQSYVLFPTSKISRIINWRFELFLLFFFVCWLRLLFNYLAIFFFRIFSWVLSFINFFLDK